MSLDQVADQLKLDRHTVVALEQGDHRSIGAVVFVRGFLRRYAALVGESPAEIEALYARRPDAEAQPDLSRTGMHRIPPASLRPRLGVGPALIAALALAVAGAAWWAMWSKPESKAVVNSEWQAPPVKLEPARSSAPASTEPAAPDLVTADEAKPPPVPGRRRLQLAFSGECWAEVYDARGWRLFFGFGHAGTAQELSGVPPYRLVLGNVEAVSVALEGTSVRLPASVPGERVRIAAQCQRRRHGASVNAGRSPRTPMSKQLQAVRGMNDVLPAQIGAWQHLERELRGLLRDYGYEELRVPVVEHTELFQRSIGEHTDIVEKEMYTFKDTGGDSLTLRPEATAGIVRAVITNGLLRGARLKLWTCGPDVPPRAAATGTVPAIQPVQRRGHRLCRPGRRRRADRPGRATVAAARHHARAPAAQFAGQQRLAAAVPRARCRGIFRLTRRALDADSRRRLVGNPLRILDSKVPAMQALIRAHRSLRITSTRTRASTLPRLCATLDGLKIPYTINPRLVRGLDYYTHTVFEWVTDALGAQDAVCSGGRYDGLISQLGGEATPAIGFALGVERVVELIGQAGTAPAARAPAVFVIASGARARRSGHAGGRATARGLPGTGRAAAPGRRQFQGAVPARRSERRLPGGDPGRRRTRARCRGRETIAS